MADDKDKKIGEVPHLENVTGTEKIPVSANGQPRYIEVKQIGPTLQDGVKGNEKNYIFSDPTIQGKGAIAAARYRANEKGRLTAQYKYWGDNDFNYNTEFPQATEKTDGVMSAEDKKKLVDVSKLAGDIDKDLDTLDFTVETLNQGLGEAEERLTEVEQCNVVAEEVVDEDTLEDFDKVTREELKKDLFNDMWNKAFLAPHIKNSASNPYEYGKYDPENAPDPQHPYRAYDLWLTYEEALDVYNFGTFDKNLDETYQKHSMAFAEAQIRCNMPPKNISWWGYYNKCGLYNTFRASLMEVIHAGFNITSDLSFYSCKKVKKILGIGALAEYANTFVGCGVLEDIEFIGVTATTKLDFKDSPKLIYDFWKRLITATTNAITITVHPNIYSALLGEATYPFNGGSQEEWQQLLQDATAKQIQFATA